VTYWLWTMVNVKLVREVSVGVAHVLASIDVEIFSLLISDFEHVFLDAVRVLSAERPDDWSVVLGSVALESLLQ